MPKTKYEIDAKQAERAIKNLAKAQKSVEDGAEQTEKKLTKAERAARRLAEQADPTKKHARQMRELAVAVNQGGLEMRHAETHAIRYQKRLEGAGQAGKQSFGPQALSQLMSYAGGFISVGAAVGTATKFLADMEAQAEAAKNRIHESLDALGQLQQLENFNQNKKFVDELVSRGAVSNKQQGAELAFAFDSSGLTKQDKDFFAYKVLRERFISPSEGAETVSTVKKAQDAFGYATFEEAFVKLVQASGGTAANIPKISENAPKFGFAFRQLGFQGDAGLAALELAEKASPNAEIAATNLNSLIVQLEKEGLAKGTFLETINAINKRVEGGEALTTIIKEGKARNAFRFFDEASEQAAFNESKGGISTALERGVFVNRVGGLRADPRTGAALLAEEAKNSREVQLEQLDARKEALFDTFYNRNAIATRRRYGELGEWLGYFAAGIDDGLQTEAQYIYSSLFNETIRGDLGAGGTFSAEEERAGLEFLIEEGNSTQAGGARKILAALNEIAQNTRESASAVSGQDVNNPRAE